MRHHLVQLGFGNVGSTLVGQIQSGKVRVLDQRGVDLVYCGLFNSKQGIFESQGLSDEQIAAFPAGSAANPVDAIKSIPLPFTLVDATSSDATPPLLHLALSRGGSVVLANKRPLAGSQADYDELQKAGRGRIFFETTVGAGLPVVSTIQDLVATSDEVLSIKGCFSGTLGYIMSRLDTGRTYSATVREALRLGFTEADPREDLSGMDVARKAIILSRLIGCSVEPADLEPEALFPTRLANLSVEEFLRSLPELDAGFGARIAAAQKRNFNLRYVARVTPTGAAVGLQEVNAASDIGTLTGPDNIVIIRTKRYSKNPIVVRGPGAGPEVTAAGLFADIIRSVEVAHD